MKAAIEIEVKKTEAGIEESDLQTLVELAQKFPDRTIRVILEDQVRERINYKEYCERRFVDDQILFATWSNADEVLDGLLEIINSYGIATVADLKDLCDLSSSYVDNLYGWADLRDRAKIIRVRNGYVLDLPKALPIK